MRVHASADWRAGPLTLAGFGAELITYRRVGATPWTAHVSPKDAEERPQPSDEEESAEEMVVGRSELLEGGSRVEAGYPAGLVAVAGVRGGDPLAAAHPDVCQR